MDSLKSIHLESSTQTEIVATRIGMVSTENRMQVFWHKVADGRVETTIETESLWWGAHLVMEY